MAKRRTFTPEFKAQVVLEALRSETSQAEVCRRHNLSADQLSKWKQQVVENVATLFASTGKQSSEEAERIAHLEPLVGRLTIEVKYVYFGSCNKLPFGTFTQKCHEVNVHGTLLSQKFFVINS